jgi:hypothetical protein
VAPSLLTTHVKSSSAATRYVASVAFVVMAASVYMLVAQQVSDRGRYWVHNVVGLDVLPNPTLKAWFVEHGLPMSPALEARTGRDAWSDGPASFLESPDLVAYRAWAATDGVRLMQRSFIENFSEHSAKLRNDWPIWRMSRGNDYDVYQSASRWPEISLQWRLTNHTFGAIAIMMLTFLIAIIGLGQGQAIRRLTAVIVVMIGTVGLEIYL